MSEDIKMSDVFCLPLHTEEGEICDSDNGLMASFTTDIQDDAAVQAINQHDTLINQVAELRAVVFEANKYLDINNLTTIGHGSNLHEWFKQALELTLKDGEL